MYTTLHNGVQIPILGFGTYLIDNGESIEQAVHHALEIGYRSIDTASFYQNESGVGKAIKDSSIPREQLFITTKVWNDDLRADNTKKAFELSLHRLDMEYVDLFLVHWPVTGHYKQAWKDVEDIYMSGRARAIGVSNFTIDHLEEVIQLGRIIPMVNQIEFHPYLRQPRLKEYCELKQIQLEAWSPLMQGHITEVAPIKRLAKKYGKSPAQITIRWAIQHKVVTIPKSSNPSRIRQNFDVFDFEITKEDMLELDKLDKGHRFGPDPMNFTF